MPPEQPTAGAPLTRQFLEGEIDQSREVVWQAAQDSTRYDEYFRGNFRPILDHYCAELKDAARKTLKGGKPANEKIKRLCPAASRILQPIFVNDHLRYLHWSILREYVRIKQLIETTHDVPCKVRLLPRDWKQRMKERRTNWIDVAEQGFNTGEFSGVVPVLHEHVDHLRTTRHLTDIDFRALALIARLVGAELWDAEEWDQLIAQLTQHGALGPEDAAELERQQRIGFESVREHAEYIEMPFAYSRGGSVGERKVHPTPINANAVRVLVNAEIRPEHDKK